MRSLLRTKRYWIFAAVAMLLVLGTTAFGQCSMCRATLAGSNGTFIRNFNIGVLVLLIPPVTIFCSIFIVLRRYRSGAETDTENQTNVDSE